VTRTGAKSSRARIRRSPKKARYDRGSIHRVLDRGPIAHVAFCDQGQTYCIPMLYGRVGDRVYIHGSRASRLVRVLAAGAPACLTVTHLDGIVLARSAFEHSANYDSVVLLGRFTAADAEERPAALEAFTEAVLPGRFAEVRPPNKKELRATQVLRMDIEEASVKTRTGPPDDDDSVDAEIDVWAGVVPVLTVYGSPQPSPGLREGVPLSASLLRIAEGRQ
jgi:uncharacterized protein